jgi:pimeloyl-ACP methyl ester carboxylesterase
MPLQEELIDVRGAKIQLYKGGKGTPLLYLHSFLAESGSIPFLEQIASEFTVYAPVLPGFNRSEGLEKIDKIEDLVFHYVDFLETAGLNQVLLVGSSLGGWLAAEIAIHHPRLIGKLVLIDALGLDLSNAPIGEIFLPKPSDFRKLLFHQHDSKLATTLLPDTLSEEGTVSLYQSRRATARVGWNPYLCDPRLAQRLYRVTMPTLLVWGGSDRVVSAEHGSAYQRAIAGSRLVSINEAGHIPVLEKPDDTARCVTEFLKS